MMQTAYFWAVPFYDFSWDQHLQHKEALVQVCRRQRQLQDRSDTALTVKRDLYESSFDFAQLPDPAVQAWAAWARDCLWQAVSHSNKQHWSPRDQIQIELHESWCHITTDGGYHDTHVHPMSSWSLIYYLERGDMDGAAKNGINRFFAPYENMYVDAGTSWTTHNTSIDIDADEGSLVVFPSWIRHNALTYRGQRERIIISANSRVSRISD